MFETFLFNVTVGGFILSVGGLAVLELTERFNARYRIVKRQSITKKENINNVKKKNCVRIARNSGEIDIKMPKDDVA